MITTSSIINTNQACVSPVIILIPNTSTITSPAQFRRNKDFFILTNIQLPCNTSITCSYQILINKTIITTYSELNIPSKILDYSICQLKLTVTIVASSASTFLRIIPSDVIPNLIQYRTSMLTFG